MNMRLNENTVASTCALDAFRACREGLAYRSGANGMPSEFAKTLLDILLSKGGVVEERITPSSPEGTPRAVVRMADESYCIVFDHGVKTAQNERQILRFADRRFADVWNGDDGQDLADSLSKSLASVPLSDEESDGVALSLNIGGQTSELETHPLNRIAPVIGVDRSQNAVISTGNQFFVVPGDAATARDVIDHAVLSAQTMASELGIPVEEILSEIQPQVELFEQVEQVFLDLKRAEETRLLQFDRLV